MTPERHARMITTLVTIACIAVAWLFFWPIVWMLASAFRPEAEIFRYLSPLSIRSVIPGHFTLRNFHLVLAAGFGRAVLNSLIVAVTTALAGLAITVPAAFALAVLRFRFRGVIFAALFVTFSVPFDLIAIPLASVFRDWHLSNSYAGLILPGLANGFAILMLRQFFAGVPTSLQEAARIDGATWLRVLVRIYLPLARPVLVSAGLLLFISQWQAYLWPLLISSKPSMELGSVALANLEAGPNGQAEFGAIFAGAVILAVIPTMLMISMQRVFVASIAATGSKE